MVQLKSSTVQYRVSLKYNYFNNLVNDMLQAVEYSTTLHLRNILYQGKENL